MNTSDAHYSGNLGFKVEMLRRNSIVDCVIVFTALSGILCRGSVVRQWPGGLELEINALRRQTRTRLWGAGDEGKDN